MEYGIPLYNDWSPESNINCSDKQSLGGVYMTPGRLSRRDEFTPVPSHGSTFVYMIPPQKVMPARVAPA